MGIGAHLTQYIKDKDVLHRFIEIELLVGIIGGISALALFVAFGLSAAPFRTLLYAFVLIVGMVVGMEIPLVMRVLNQKGAEFKELVSKVLTFDYLEAHLLSRYYFRSCSPPNSAWRVPPCCLAFSTPPSPI